MHGETQGWQAVDWDSVVVDGVSVAGTGCTVVWGRGPDGTARLGLLDGRVPIRDVHLPAEVTEHGPVRVVRWGYETPHGPSWEAAYRLLGVCGAAGAWVGDWGGTITPVVVPDDEEGRSATFLWPLAGDE